MLTTCAIINQVNQPERGKALLLMAVKDWVYPWRHYFFLPVILFSVQPAHLQEVQRHIHIYYQDHTVFAKTKKIIKLIRGSHPYGRDPAALLLAASVRAVKGAIAPPTAAYALDCTTIAALSGIIVLAGLGFLVSPAAIWHPDQKSPALSGAFFCGSS